ncbi:MBL fold metallo-hydrolase [Amycolatopsis sp. CA-230715]|uniref:MBL fold metallo-hydrolase n=1 Tax=Amycolatopsis sp. CA-230715 TaxID=2745196 RepID=UPI001C027499|nr:MBL fold metallo-hydrolase [Amycolatopsis sp. CA-230715]QWF78845.1 Ribonuclease BN [Amycolatopsis sp. CA-230715]
MSQSGTSRRAALGLSGLAAVSAVAGGSAEAVATEKLDLSADTLITLGTTAGPPVERGRVGIGSALVTGGRAYVVDCGRGTVAQYVESGLTFADLGAIFLTHLHADHIADFYDYFLCAGWLTNVPGAPGDGPFPPKPTHRVPVHGPGRAGGLPPSRVGVPPSHVGGHQETPGTVDLTENLHKAFAYSSNVFNRDAGIIDIRELAEPHDIRLPHVGADHRNTAPPMEPFGVYHDENVRVSAILVPHYDVFPSFAFRFDTATGKSVTFSGDTVKSDNVVRLARGTDLLVHECIFTLNSVYHQRSHTSAEQVGEVAAAAAAGKVVVSHYDPPGLDDRVWFDAIGKAYRGPAAIARDGQRFTL